MRLARRNRWVLVFRVSQTAPLVIADLIACLLSPAASCNKSTASLPLASTVTCNSRLWSDVCIFLSPVDCCNGMTMASTNNRVPAQGPRLSCLVPVPDSILLPSVFELVPLRVKLGHCG